MKSILFYDLTETTIGALPSTKAFASGHVSRFTLMRLWIGLGLFAILMGAATVSLF